MLIDLKYHLTSLVAVFLALAVGMLVGSSYIASSSLTGLEREFASLRVENRQNRKTIEALREELEKHKEFGSSAAPFLVDNLLRFYRVAIIQTGDYEDAAQRAKAILEKAGAEVISVTTVFDLTSKTAKHRATNAVIALTGGNEPDPIGSVLETLAKCIATGADSGAIDILEENGLIAKVGQYNQRVTHVVLVGGCKVQHSKRPEKVDLVLIDKLTNFGVKSIVGVEPLVVGTSYIPLYHRKAVTTVDNIDQYIGQVCLVYAIAGETGSFGVKSSADKVSPDFSRFLK
jgi:uncharacterized membrane-anchored protein YhcB (DUF1043 family)